MADPRLGVGYNNIGMVTATFLIDNSTITYSATADGGAASTMLNMAVKMTAADTVGLATAGSAVVGKLLKVESDNVCTVQIAGGMTLPAGTGHAANNVLTLGGKIVGDVSTAANGYIRGATTNAWNADVIYARGVVLDLGTTTAVEVFL